MQEPWKTDKWFTSPWCHLPEVRKDLKFRNDIKIYDVTLRDGFEALATHGWLGSAMSEPQVAYSVVYHLEIALLFGTLIAIGPLVRTRGAPLSSRQRFGLAEFPG